MQRKIKFITVIAIVFFSVVAGGVGPAAMAAQRHTPEDEVSRYLQREMQDRRIPGLQLAVVQGGKIVMLKSYGLAELQHAIPVTNSSVFSINSATKSFTGVAVMQLVDQGKLDLSAPVSRYLKDLPAPWQDVTITQLLTHISGIPDIIDQKTSRLATAGGAEAAWKQVQAMPMDFARGERYSYNQTNYLLLGKLIDQLSGQPFVQFIQQRQFDAVGMRQTGFGDVHDVIPDKAVSYVFDQDGATLKQVIDEFPAFLRTGAGINSSAENLARWIIALQKGKLLSDAGLKQLWTPGHFNDGSTTPWALGWPTRRQKEYRAVAGIGGMRSAFFVYPDNDLAVVILTNLAGASPEGMIDTVAGYFLPGLRSVDGSYTVYRLREAVQKNGFDHLDEQLAKLKKQDGLVDASEEELNLWGYRLLGQKKNQPAIAVLHLATQLYPRSANADDSLAEAYEAAGKTDLAVQHYRRSLERDPKNQHATDRLRVIDQKAN